MKILNLIIYSVSTLATLSLIVTGAFVLPVIGPELRKFVYGLSRCWAPNRLGQVGIHCPRENKDTNSTSACEQVSIFIAQKMNHILNMSYVCVAFYLAGLLPYFIKDKWELDTAYVVLAIAVIYLLSMYLPKMEKPHLHTSFVGPIDTAFCDKHCTCIVLSPGQTCPIEIRVANTGLIYYKDCTFWVKFPEGIIILPTDHEGYKKLQFHKSLTIGSAQNICVISPRNNDLSFASFTEISLPVCVDLPSNCTKGETIKVEVSATSESTWGRTYSELRIKIT